jgi:tetratricopeptide (TPR) repeat protein
LAKLGDFFGGGEQRPEVEAQKQLREGNFLAAGKLLETAGKLSQAAEAYLQGKEYHAAAEVCDRLGRRDQAADLFLKVGDFKRAAEALARGGNVLKAADLLSQRGQSQEAAKLYAQAGAWSKAAELYVKGGYPLRAAQAYEKQGDLKNAAESYERHFVENVAYGSGQTSTSSADHRAALHAGRLWAQAGNPERALQIYARAGFHKEAAETALALQQFAKAAELFTRAEDLEKAADAWDKAGNRVQAALLRGEVAFKDDRMAEAAAFFQEGQDYYRAAELFESLGLLAEAAGAYEAGGSFGDAASVYLRSGDRAGAAAAHEKAGQYEQAAKLFEELGDGASAAPLFEKAGLTYKSGEAAARAGEREKAIALLQRVAPDDEHYAAASELLARMFLEVGMPALAQERLQQSLQGQPMSLANLSLHHLLGVCLEASGDKPGALALYKKILALDYSYRDVAQRIRELQSGGGYAVADAEYEVVEEVAPTPASDATAAAPATVPAAGPRFAPQEEIGRGPLGTVYRAQDQTDGRSVALRVLPQQALKPELLGSLVGDLVAAARLSHPNLVKVLGVVDFENQSCVLSEFVRGSNLAESLRAGQRMSVHQCHSLGRTLAQVLSFVHARGLAHGSIRPSNIMTLSGVVKLADLGLGRLYRDAVAPDAYRAPENRFDLTGDLYSLGAVLYHALTGVEPRLRSGVPMTRPSQLAPGVPERFDRFLLRCLETNPEARFAATDELIGALEAMITIS